MDLIDLLARLFHKNCPHAATEAKVGISESKSQMALTTKPVASVHRPSPPPPKVPQKPVDDYWAPLISTPLEEIESIHDMINRQIKEGKLEVIPCEPDQERESPPIPEGLESDQLGSPAGGRAAMPIMSSLQRFDWIPARTDPEIPSPVIRKPVGCVERLAPRAGAIGKPDQDNSYSSPHRRQPGEQLPEQPDRSLSTMPPLRRPETPGRPEKP